MDKPAPVAGEKVWFAKFDGGVIVRAQADLKELTEDSVILTYDGMDMSFRRAPGAKAGWGVGHAKSCRIDDEARKRFCHPDVRTR